MMQVATNGMDGSMRWGAWGWAVAASLLSAGAVAAQEVGVAEPPEAVVLEGTLGAEVGSEMEAEGVDEAVEFSQGTTMQERDDRVIRVLDNRMVLVAQRVPVAPVVSVQVWVKTGSLYEQEHVGAGLSHFLEHLLSGGSTSTRSEAESNAILAKIGAQTNAGTSLDTVRYYINTTRDHAPTAIELMSDWMQNNVVLEAEYAREREVIQREFSMGKGDPNRIFWKATQSARFVATPEHPGAHPTIGYLDEFLTISRDELEAFYRRMYVPNNMVFVVTGDIEPQRVMKQLTELWQGVPTGELPALAFPVEPERASVEPTLKEVVADIKLPRVRLFWRGVGLASEHDFALDLAASVLGQGESSRLVRSLRDEQGLVTSIDAYNFSTTWGDGFFGVDFQPAAGVELETVEAAVLAEVDRLRTEPVTDEELARAKRKVLSGVLQSGQSAEAVAGRIASDLIGQGDPDYLRRYADAVQDVGWERLRSAVSAVALPGKHSKVVMRPAEAGQSVVALERGALEADPGRESVAFELDNARVIERMETALAESSDAVEPMTLEEPVTATLDNGLTVIVRRSTVVPAVSMQLYTLGGLLADGPGQEGLGNAAMSMLDRGAAGLSAEQLSAMLEDLGATLGTAAANNTNYVTASALEEDWPAVMATMADVVLRPDFPESEWASLQPRLLAAIDRQDDRWSGELRRVFREAYYGEHPWSQTTLGRRSVVEGATADDLRAAYFEGLSANRSVLSIVGDVEPSAAIAVAESLFAEMPSGPSGFEPPMPSSPSAGLTVWSTGKPVTAVQIGFGPGVSRDHPDYAGLQVLSRVISAFPSGWLDQALRGEGPGLVYAVSAGNVSGLIPGYFTALFNTTADTSEEALSRTMAVMERARTELADASTLAAAKSKVLADEFRRKQSNADLAQGAALDRLYGVDDPSGEAFMEAVNAVTPERLREIAVQYLVDPVGVVITQEPVDAERLEAVLLGGE